MATLTTTIDDLTGTTLDGPVEPTTVTIDGTEYKIDLSDQSKARLIGWLKGEDTPLIKTQRRTAAKRTSGDARGKDTTEKYGYTAKEVREWARAANHKIDGQPVAAAGRVSQGFYDAYKAYKNSGS